MHNAEKETELCASEMKRSLLPLFTLLLLHFFARAKYDHVFRLCFNDNLVLVPFSMSSFGRLHLAPNRQLPPSEDAHLLHVQAAEHRANLNDSELNASNRLKQRSDIQHAQTFIK